MYESHDLNELNDLSSGQQNSGQQNRIRLNKTSVEALPNQESGQKLYRDADLPGFGLRVTASSKTYICEYWLAEKKKSVRFTLGKHGKITAEEARKKARQLLGYSAEGLDANEKKRSVKADQTTLNEVWLQYREVRELRPKTVKVYESALRRGLSDWLDLPICRITRPMIKARQRELGKAVGPRSNPEGATENANQIMRVLRSMLIFARDEYVTEDKRELRLPDGFATGFPKAYAKKRRHRRIEDGDLASWYKAVMQLQSDSVRDMLLVCLFTGMRRGEAANLTWDKINLKDGFIQLRPADTKNNEPHRVYLSNFLVNLFEEKELYRDDLNPFVFPSRVPGKPIGEPKASINKVTKATKIEFSTHDLRRTYLSIAQSIEAPYAVSKILANHKRGSDITESYITVSPEKLRHYQQKITDRLASLMGIALSNEAE